MAFTTVRTFSGWTVLFTWTVAMDCTVVDYCRLQTMNYLMLRTKNTSEHYFANWKILADDL